MKADNDRWIKDLQRAARVANEKEDYDLLIERAHKTLSREYMTYYIDINRYVELQGDRN